MKQSLIKTSGRKSAKVLIIYTGGTIGMVQDHISGQLKPINFDQIREQVPEMRKFDYRIDVLSFDPVLDSSNMKPGHWVKMVEIIRDHYKSYDGFVILHGSDTLAYTASALSFMIENLGKPVILTGSQLPVGEVRTDAKENLITAIEIAAAKERGRAVVPEVCVYFDYYLFRGNRSVKMNASKFEAFQSVNLPPLAEAGVHIRYNRKLIMPHPTGKVKFHTKLDCNVGLVRLFPGMSQSWFSAQFQARGLKAVVLETFGSGNAPTDKWFLKTIEKAVSRGLVLVNVTQCRGGRVEQGVYATSAGMAELGVVGGGDLTAEAAVTKLMYLFGKDYKSTDIKAFMVVPLRGELT
jgi:L-asparaginase